MTIDPELQKYIQDEALRIATAVYEDKGTMYGVGEVPTHTHNNIDSTSVPAGSVDGMIALPSTTGGVANRDVLGDSQVINSSAQATNPLYARQQNLSSAIYVNPIPTIYGTGGASFNGGTAPVGTLLLFVNPENPDVQAELWARVETAVDFNSLSVLLNGDIPIGSETLASSLNAGDTSAHFSSSWTGTTGTFNVVFSNSETRDCHVTHGSTAIGWTGGLASPATTSVLVFSCKSATLASTWNHSSGYFTTTFSNGDILQALFTKGSETIGTFSASIISSATSAITVTSLGWYGTNLLLGT